MKILEAAVRSSGDFSEWHGDYSPESLKQIAAWFAANVTTELIVPQPITVRGRQVGSVDYKLSGETYTRSFDAGIYYGETLVRSNSDFAWDIVSTGSRRRQNYGNAVIRGSNGAALDPVVVLVTFAHSVVQKRYGPQRIYDQYWRAVDMLNGAEKGGKS